MNKHRNLQHHLSFPEMILLIFAAIVLMAAGVTHAWLKNSQVEVMRGVDKIQQQINDHEGSINSLQVKIDKKLNIYQLRDDLERSGSQLVLIPVSALEKIPPYPHGEIAERSRDHASLATRIRP